MFSYRLSRLAPKIIFAFAAASLLFSVSAHAEDQIEFLTGLSVRGKVTKIDKENRIIHFETTVAGRKSVRKYEYARIHKVNYRGKEHVLNKMQGGTSQNAVLTPAEVLKKVKEEGSQTPTWYAATQVEHPKSLDLSWPIKPPKEGWNSQRNVGQYLWDVIYPNPGRWQSGIRLVQHLLEQHEGNRTLVKRDRRTLGSMYFRLFQDYPRAAYWLQLGQVTKNDNEATMLAECYWRMGSRELGLDWLRSNRVSVGKIKLLGDMGETDFAVGLTKSFGNSNAKHQAFLAAGDALRLAKRYDEAIAFYKKVLAAKPHKNAQYNARFRGRAQESITAIKLFEQFDLNRQADGTFKASSVGYNGPIEVEVVVKDKSIESVRVLKHREKQFYSAINDTTNQIVKSQDIREIDGTTSATITSQAIVNATAKALGSTQ